MAEKTIQQLPINAVIRITNPDDLKAFEEAIQLVPKLKVEYRNDAEMSGATEAYVMVGGQRVASGNLTTMMDRFKTEINIHKAPVTLHAKEGGTWRVKQRRSNQNVTS